MSAYGRCPIVLLEVALSNGEVASNITIKGKHKGDYFIYDSTIKGWRVFSTQVIIGDHTSYDGTTTLGVGAKSGLINQSSTAVAVGYASGNNTQRDNAIAIGPNAGQQLQRANVIAIGANAGYSTQLTSAIAIGANAGRINQGTTSIAIGANAGYSSQRSGAIAIGFSAGQTNQGSNSIAIGANAGQTNQGSNSIIIGANVNNTYASSIVMNATATPFYPTSGGVFIRPVRGPNLAMNLLSYDTTTKEVFYNGSSGRYKYDIRDLSSKTAVDKLQPREFKYKLDDVPDIGLIAEEAYACDNAFAYLDENRLPEGIQWNAITVSLLRELQSLKERVAILKNNTF